MILIIMMTWVGAILAICLYTKICIGHLERYVRIGLL